MEEDINILRSKNEIYLTDKQSINLLEEIEKNCYKKTTYQDEYRYHKAKAIENLIKRNEELEEKCQRYKKSKDEYKNKYIEVTNFYLESVPYSTIKEKIEELEEEKKHYYSDYKIDELNDKIQVLQELMEDK